MTVRLPIRVPIRTTVRQGIEGGEGNCQGWYMCLEVGNDGSTMYGFTVNGPYGSVKPTTFLGLPIYSIIFDIADGACYARLGDNGDEQAPNIESIDWDFDGYDSNPVLWTWSATNLRYEITDQALADYMASMLGEFVGMNPIAHISYVPLEAHPDWTIINGDPGPTNSRWDDGIVSLNTFGGESVVAFQDAIFVDGSISATIFDGLSPSNNGNTFFLAVRMVDIDNYIGFRAYNGLYDIYEKIGGTYFKLGDFVQPAGNNDVTLSVAGDQITVDIDGVIYNYTTAHLVEGFAGILMRSWEPFMQQVATGYTVSYDIPANYVTYNGRIVTHLGVPVTKD